MSSFFTGLISWIVFYLAVLPDTMEANMDVLIEGQVFMDWAIDDAIFISLIPAAGISFLTLIIISLLTGRKKPDPYS